MKEARVGENEEILLRRFSVFLFDLLLKSRMLWFNEGQENYC
jgi:hypothetical protein